MRRFLPFAILAGKPTGGAPEHVPGGEVESPIENGLLVADDEALPKRRKCARAVSLSPTDLVACADGTR